MRPGEPGHGRGKRPFDPRLGICLAHLIFWSPSVNPNADGRWAMCMLIRPIKDNTGEQERRPTVISSLHQGGEPNDDPCCTYSHVLRLWRRRVSEVCRQRAPCTGPAFCAQCSASPLFAWPGSGRPWSSADGLAVVKDMAAAIGLDPADFGGHSGRIAGGSDIRDALGLERGRAVVHQRGRWNDTMEDIYVRETAAEQMEASRLMVEARRPEVEAAFWELLEARSIQVSSRLPSQPPMEKGRLAKHTNSYTPPTTATAATAAAAVATTDTPHDARGWATVLDPW